MAAVAVAPVVKRRRALRLVGAAAASLGGCLSTNSAEGPDRGGETTDERTKAGARTTTDPPGEATATTVRPGTPLTVAVKSVDDAALRDRLGVTAAVEVGRARITAERTARVTVALRDVDREPRTLWMDADCHFPRFRGSRDGAVGGDRAAVQLLSPGRERRADDGGDGACWTPALYECGMPTTPEAVELGDDGTRRWALEVWADPRNVHTGVCLPSGTYRFALGFRGREDGDGGATLAFALRLSAE